jgi:hypothetical protein
MDTTPWVPCGRAVACTGLIEACATTTYGSSPPAALAVLGGSGSPNDRDER